MNNLVYFDLEAMEKHFSKNKENIPEIILLKSVVARRRNMIRADTNNYKQTRLGVLKSLERNMFTQEMKAMAIILMREYGEYTSDGRYYYKDYYKNKLVKDPRRRTCQITSHGLHLTLSSLNE